MKRSHSLPDDYATKERYYSALSRRELQAVSKTKGLRANGTVRSVKSEF